MTELREPAHRVCPRAVGYWRVSALLTALVPWIGAVVVLLVWPDRPWWASAGAVVLVVVPLAHVLVMPQVRYRIHRWEVTPTGIHTRAGWVSTETRIAPLSRVQTVDSVQGPLMRPFRLASITVTTASAAGPITIVGLDADHARELVARLTEVTAATEGDAT